jgi:hypothetical protein
MSLVTGITSLFNDYNNTLCSAIAKEFDIDEKKLISFVKQRFSDGESDTASCASIDESNLATLSKSELAILCKKRNLKVSGKKEELLARLTGVEESKASASKASASKASVSKASVSKASTSKASTSKASTSKVIEEVKKTASFISIKKNKFGNYEHFDTGLVFNRDTSVVYGRQTEDGPVERLTQEDLEICKQHKFKVDPASLPAETHLGSDEGDMSGDMSDDMLEDELEDELEEV